MTSCEKQCGLFAGNKVRSSKWAKQIGRRDRKKNQEMQRSKVHGEDIRIR